MSTSGAEKRMSLYEALRSALPEQLPAYLLQQRWFGGKARQIRSSELIDVVPLQTGKVEALLVLARVEYGSGPGDTFVLPMILSSASAAPDAGRGAVLEMGADGVSGGRVLRDALTNDEFLSCLLNALEVKLTSKGLRGEIQADHTSVFQDIRSQAGDDLLPRLLKGEQSNSSIAYGERLILKFFRRLEEGVNPDLEVGLFLTESAHFPNVPPVAGSLEYRDNSGRPMTVGIAQKFVPNRGDAWRFTLESLERFWEDVANASSLPPSRPAATAHPVLAEEADVLPNARAVIGHYLDKVELLGTRTAQLHLALASGSADRAFAPESSNPSFLSDTAGSAEALAARNFGLLRNRLGGLSQEARARASAILDRETEVLEKFRKLPEAANMGMRIRIHGDYHLGQVLFTGSDFMIIDFEGEPARPLAERRVKRSALQDVAGMLRSFHYAAFAQLFATGAEAHARAQGAERFFAWAERWYAWAASRFLNSYFEMAQSGSFLPPGRSEISAVLQFHLLEKAVYELGYELNNRPSWVGIPLAGISQLLAG
jgi:trehalose synthase-fused probable maltokinase